MRSPRLRKPTRSCKSLLFPAEPIHPLTHFRFVAVQEGNRMRRNKFSGIIFGILAIMAVTLALASSAALDSVTFSTPTGLSTHEGC